MRMLVRAMLMAGAGTLGVVVPSALAQDKPGQTAGSRYKSVQVLRDIPSDQLIPTMAMIANSLGVTCSHCHTSEWESDDKPNKQKGREMMRLTQAINRDHFGGRLVVTCQTCHDGRAVPASVPRVEDAGWNRPKPPPAPPLPEIDAVLAAYARAMGGEGLQRYKSRLVMGTVTRFNGRSDPVSGTFRLFQEGNTARLSTELSHPPEADAEVSASFARPLVTARVYADLHVTGAERIRNRDVIVVSGNNPRGIEHRMYFDAKSGLLLRRADEVPTVLGRLPEHYDLDDYRQVDGVMVPHTIQWSRGDYQVTFRFETVAHDAPDPGK